MAFNCQLQITIYVIQFVFPSPWSSIRGLALKAPHRPSAKNRSLKHRPEFWNFGNFGKEWTLAMNGHANDRWFTSSTVVAKFCTRCSAILIVGNDRTVWLCCNWFSESESSSQVFLLRWHRSSCWSSVTIILMRSASKTLFQICIRFSVDISCYLSSMSLFEKRYWDRISQHQNCICAVGVIFCVYFDHR